jgi:crotonobetainyl-CoA:carnitine CoA-transferase CaiB-like acyl-CoA transferase
VVPYRVFHTVDRAIAIAVGSEKLWSAFCRAIERPELERHPDYASNAARIRHREELEPLLEEVFRTRSGTQWMERMRAGGIPASLVNNFQDVAEHPQSAARHMFPEIEHPTAGRHRVTGTPVKLSDTPGSHGEPAPLLGQHTLDVLRELLGLDGAALDALAQRAVVYDPATIANGE